MMVEAIVMLSQIMDDPGKSTGHARASRLIALILTHNGALFDEILTHREMLINGPHSVNHLDGTIEIHYVRNMFEYDYPEQEKAET